MLEDIGGPGLLLDLQTATPAISNAGRYGRIVRDTALLRRLIGVAGEIAEIAYDEPDDVTKALDEAENKVFQLADHQVTDCTRPLSDLLGEAFDDLQAAYERGSALTGVATGYHDLDELLSGPAARHAQRRRGSARRWARPPSPSAPPPTSPSTVVCRCCSSPWRWATRS